MSDFKHRETVSTIRSKSLPLFWLGFWLLFVKFLWQATVVIPANETVSRVLLLLGMMFLLMRIAAQFQHYEKPGLVIIGLIVAVVSYVLSGETVLLSTLLVIFAASGVGSQNIIKAWCRAVLPILGLMLAAYAIALLTNDTAGMAFSNMGGFRETRNSLFFVHPNYCGAFFFSYAIGQCMRKDVPVIMKAACYIGCLTVIFFITGSRTSTLALLSYPMLVLVLRFAFGKNGKRAVLGTTMSVVLVPIVLAAFTYWLGSYWFTSPMFSQDVSDLLTGRPALWWAQYNYVGLSLFGQPAFQGIILVRGTYHEVSTVDGMYSSFLYNIGIVGFSYILILLYLWTRNAKTNEIESMSAAILSLFLFGFCEWHAMNAFVCVPLLLLGDAMKLKDSVVKVGNSSKTNRAATTNNQSEELIANARGTNDMVLLKQLW